MDEKYLEMAKLKVADTRVLINGAASRAKELARGARPLIPVSPGEVLNWLDVALQEIAEDKIILIVE